MSDTESPFVKHAEIELALIGMGADAKDEMNKLMHDQIMEMVKLFSSHGHSGFSAPYALSILTRLLDWKPLSPLTGEDDEWNDVTEMMGGKSKLWQNKRLSRVFKEQLPDGSFQTYDIEGKVFYHKGERSNTFTRQPDSRVYITFPYTPPAKPEYIEVEKDATDD